MNTLTILGTSLLLAVFVLAGRGGGAIGQPPGPPAQAWQDALSPAWTPPPDSPAPTPSPTPYSATSSVTVPPSGSIEALACSYDWPCLEAVSVMLCESGGDPAAYNPGGAKGLMQLMPIHQWRAPGGDFFDAATNLEVSYALYLDQGWGPWVCKP